MERAPCWTAGQPCLNKCAAADYQRLVLNQVELTGPWLGWRLAGCDPVSPDGQRISPERLRGLIFRQSTPRHTDHWSGKPTHAYQRTRTCRVRCLPLPPPEGPT